MTIGKKLKGSLFATLIVVALFSVLSITGFRSMRANTSLLVDNYAAKLALVGKLSTAEGNMLAAQRGMMVEALTGNAEAREQKRHVYDEQRDKFRRYIEQITPLLLTTQSRGFVSHAAGNAQQWEAGFQTLAAAAADGKAAEAWATQKAQLADLAYGIEKDMGGLTALLESQMTENKERVDSEASWSVWYSILLAAIAAGVGCLSFFIITGVSRQLRGTVSSLAEVASRVSNAARQISSSSQGLAQNASAQAASIEETASAAQTISGLTRENAEAAKAASTEMEQSMAAIASLNKASTELAASIGDVSASSGKIAGIIRLIDEIAFQTNILALNAAVEAARAGEVGKGFAVVADEVRELAHRCAKAANDTSSLIEGAVDKTDNCQRRLEGVLSGLQTNSELARQAKSRVDVVSRASDEQAAGLRSISSAVIQIQSVTQQAAASAEENASAGMDLSSQARNLEKSVRHLALMVDNG